MHKRGDEYSCLLLLTETQNLFFMINWSRPWMLTGETVSDYSSIWFCLPSTVRNAFLCFRVKPAVFDLLLALCIASYLGVLYLAIQVQETFFKHCGFIVINICAIKPCFSCSGRILDFCTVFCGELQLLASSSTKPQTRLFRTCQECVFLSMDLIFIWTWVRTSLRATDAQNSWWSCVTEYSTKRSVTHGLVII